jgi:hypothetical protein
LENYVHERIDLEKSAEVEISYSTIKLIGCEALLGTAA